MSQGVYINTLNTYIGTALYEEFLGEKPEESNWSIYSCYYENEDNTKPAFIKKMMKPKEKPMLFKKYALEKFEVMIYDMHSGRLQDLKDLMKSILTKAPFEKEKIIIMISSVLSWANTEHKFIEEKPPKIGEDGEIIPEEEEEKSIEENMEGEDGDDQDKVENIKKDDVPDDGLTPEERERKKFLEKIDVNEDYFNNSINMDEDGKEIEVLDSEGNILEKEDEEYKEKLKTIKIERKIEKLKNVKIEIKVS